MRVKSALTQSKQHARILAPLAALSWIVVVWRYNHGFLALALLLTFVLAGDLVNILSIQKKARRNPDYLQDRTR